MSAIFAGFLVVCRTVATRAIFWMIWAWLAERPTGFQQAIASFSASRASAPAEK